MVIDFKRFLIKLGKNVAIQAFKNLMFDFFLCILLDLVIHLKRLQY